MINLLDILEFVINFLKFLLELKKITDFLGFLVDFSVMELKLWKSCKTCKTFADLFNKQDNGRLELVPHYPRNQMRPCLLSSLREYEAYSATSGVTPADIVTAVDLSNEVIVKIFII